MKLAALLCAALVAGTNGDFANLLSGLNPVLAAKPATSSAHKFAALDAELGDCKRSAQACDAAQVPTECSELNTTLRAVEGCVDDAGCSKISAPACAFVLGSNGNLINKLPQCPDVVACGLPLGGCDYIDVATCIYNKNLELGLTSSSNLCTDLQTVMDKIVAPCFAKCTDYSEQLCEYMALESGCTTTNCNAVKSSASNALPGALALTATGFLALSGHCN